MCLSPKAPKLPDPPKPVEPPAPLVSPEEVKQTTASTRKASSRSKLRLDVGGTGGIGAGLYLPE